MFFSLENKVAVITGAASGIGLATARRFAKAGARVVMGDISDASAIAKEIGGVFLATDVSKEEQVEALMQKAVDEFGGLDIVVNNAGIGIVQHPLLEEPDELYRKHFEVNTMGVVYGIKHASTRMKNGGSIINTGSAAGMIGFPFGPAYTTSKMAAIGITKGSAIDLGPKGIRVNHICPSTVDTPMGFVDNAYMNTATQRGYVSKPEEIAATIHFLAADDCQYITGQAIMLDGGLGVGPSLALLGKFMDDDSGLE